MLEKDLYPHVEAFARKYLRCFTTKTDTGPKLGRIDIVGLRDTGGDLDGSSEVIAIEVKRGKQPFLTAAGQAVAYSIYADRCYLADIRDDGYTEDEKTIASRLGLGLLRLTIGKQVRVHEDQIAPIGSPLPRFRLELVEKLGHSLCTICGSFFKRGTETNFRANVTAQKDDPKWRERAHEQERGLMYWLEEQDGRRDHGRDVPYTRRYVCPSCTKSLFS